MKRTALVLSLVMGALSSDPGYGASNSVVNLSHYDTVVPNFAAMKKEGVVGVIHESTYPPGSIDPKYATRQEDATRAGLLWGAYHFGNGTDPKRQADFFVDAVGKHARGGGTRPSSVLLVLDFEQNRHYPGGSMTVAQAAAFVRRVRERTGKFPGLYSNENTVKTVLGNPLINSGDREALKNCWLWIANYHYEPRQTSPWNGWKLWQYTGDGICDLPRKLFPTTVANVPRAERNMFSGSKEAAASFWRERSWQIE